MFATDLVYGDLVMIKSGDKMPADLLLIETSRDLKVRARFVGDF